MPDLEPFAAYFLAAGAAVLFIGVLWLLWVAFKSGFIKQALLPLLVVLVGAGVALFVPVMNKLFPKPIDTKGKVEQKTDAEGNVEERLTLTGATREEYAKLKAAKYAVIQWSNQDVTDDDAAVLGTQTELRELKLNDTQITDATLERLVKLPKLTKLFIARTKVTPDGVVQHLLKNPDCKLTEIDVSDLKVPGVAVREWKAADKTRLVSQ